MDLTTHEPIGVFRVGANAPAQARLLARQLLDHPERRVRIALPAGTATLHDGQQTTGTASAAAIELLLAAGALEEAAVTAYRRVLAPVDAALRRFLNPPPAPAPAPQPEPPAQPEPAPSAPEPSEPMPRLTLPPDGTSIVAAHLAETIGWNAARARELVRKDGLTGWQQGHRRRWMVVVDQALLDALEARGYLPADERDEREWETAATPADVSVKRPEPESAPLASAAPDPASDTTGPRSRALPHNPASLGHDRPPAPTHAGDGAADDPEAPVDPDQEARDSAFLRNVADRLTDPGLRKLLHGLAASEPPAPSIPGPGKVLGMLAACGEDRELVAVIEDAQQEAAAVARYLLRTRDALHVTRQRLEGYAEGAIVEMAVDELSVALGAVADVEARLAAARRRLPIHAAA